jgi:hypothetical protein
MLQDILAIVILLAAITYLVWRGFRMTRGKKNGCGCDTCPVEKKKL